MPGTLDLIRGVGRLMLSGVFIAGGADAVRNPEYPAQKAEEELGVPKPTLAARVNGATMVAGGAMVGLGYRPRLGPTLLAGSLVPTTLAGHPFWEEDDEQARTNQQIHFFKNLAMLGAALLIIADHPR
jgi:putative oxidoreductase